MYPDIPPEFREFMRNKKTRRMIMECRTLRSMIGDGGNCEPEVYYEIGEKIRPYVEEAKMGVINCTSKLGTNITCNVRETRILNYRGRADKPGTFARGRETRHFYQFMKVDMAHTVMLVEQKILTREEGSKILKILKEINELGQEGFVRALAVVYMFYNT